MPSSKLSANQGLGLGIGGPAPILPLGISGHASLASRSPFRPYSGAGSELFGNSMPSTKQSIEASQKSSSHDGAERKMRANLAISASPLSSAIAARKR